VLAFQSWLAARNPAAVQDSGAHSPRATAERAASGGPL
jgi:hypothetical protein